MKTENRLKLIMKTSVVGIITNAFLSVFKLIIGIISGSIAIMLDGVNNMADAASSLITIIGAAFGARPADAKHPFGYGRMEYLSSLAISGLVLYAGVTAFVESLKKILHPEAPDYSTLTLIIVAVAIVVKLALALYTQHMGKKTNSDSLVASGKDAIMDVMLSLSTLVAAIIFVIFKFSLESYLGAIISVIIIKAGLELLGETISKIIGEPTEFQLVIDIKNTIKTFPEVQGAYDLVLNNYGPDTYMASVHVAVDEKLTVAELDKLSRDISDLVLKKHNIYLAAIGFYSKNSSNASIQEAEQEVAKIVLNMEHILGIHAFYMDPANHIMRFDLVVSLNAKNRKAAYTAALDAVKTQYPDYDIIAGFDMDFNELVK